jgi:thermostable 8-oxoguanine DNA glycosylase
LEIALKTNYEEAYFAAKKLLIKILDSADADKVLEHYLIMPDSSKTHATIPELYKRLLVSAQNANMKAGVIGGSIGGVENLGKVLYDFNPANVVERFGNSPESLLEEIIVKLKPRGEIRKTERSLWPQYCKTIISAAKFFQQFNEAKDFYQWANHLYDDKRSIAALPMIIKEEIDGIGYPLACDFLKEMGFTNYGKPDVHVVEIFEGIGLCKKNSNPYEVQKVIVSIAESVGVSPYNVDKLFWLIGSGKFYNHPNIGNGGMIGRNKEKFISLFNARHFSS